MKRFVAPLLVWAGFLAGSVFGLTATEEIAAGRTALAAHDVSAARGHFSTALTLEPANQTAAALRGFATWFDTLNAPATEAWLDRLGVASAGRNLYGWTAQPTFDSDQVPVLPTDLDLAEFGAYLHTTLVPAGEAARADLALVTDPQFLLTLSPDETGSPLPITIDYADVLTARAALRGWEVLEHFLQGQNLALNVHRFIELAQGNLLSIQAVLAENPDFLKAGDYAERQQTVAALRDFAAIYGQASKAIRSRPAGLSRLFMLETGDDFAMEAEFRSSLAQIIASLDHYVQFDSEDPYQPLAKIGAAFNPDFSIRGLMPATVDGTVDPFGAIDTSMGGLLAGQSREAAVSLYREAFGLQLNPGWTWLNPRPQGNTFTGYAYGNNRHVAINAAGAVLTSPDGVAWTLRQIAGADRIAGLASDGTMFVGVGPGGVFHSSDGVTWTAGDGLPDWVRVEKVVLASGRFVAAGDYGYAAYSDDGVHWNWSYASGYSHLQALTYGLGHFVIVGGSQQQSQVLVSTDGQNWTPAGTADGALLGAAASDTRAVAVGAAGLVLTTTDGQNWATVAALSDGTAAATTFRAVAWRSGAFVLAGVTTTASGPQYRALRSTDGLTWTAATLPSGGGDLRALAVGPDAIYGLGAGGFIARSTTGASFALASGGTGVTFTNLAADKGRLNGLLATGGKLIAYGATGTILTTTDGTTATAVSSGTTADLRGGAAANGTAVLVGAGGTVLTSTGGGWTSRSSGTGNALNAVRRCGSLFVAVGDSATILTSADGTTWTQRSAADSTTLTGGWNGSVTGPVTFYDVAYGNGKYLAVGGIEDTSNIYYSYIYPVIATSVNGTSWTLAIATNAAYAEIRGIDFADGQFIMADMEGLHRSADGLSWAWVEPGDQPSNAMASVSVAADGRWYATTAVSYYGEHLSPPAQALVSSNGRSWWLLDLPVTSDVTDAEVFGGHVYFVAGHGGLIRVNGTVGPIAAPTLAASPQPQTAAEGGRVVLDVAADAEGTVTYVWKHDGVVVAGATGPRLVLNNLSTAEAGDYTVTVTNGAGSVTSPAATVTVTAGSRLTSVLWGGGGIASVRTTAPAIPIVGDVVAVATGYSHTVFLKSDHTLWGMGSNASGQLGQGATVSVPSPVQIATGVASVSAAGSQTFFVTLDGTLWATGYNYYGQLGSGTTMTSTTPVSVASSVQAVAAGADYTLVLKTDGTLWSVGYNSSGQLGDGTTANRADLVQIAAGVARIAAGADHSLYVTTAGELWGVGDNQDGELGDGTTTDHLSPVHIADGVVDLAAGNGFSLYLTTDGIAHLCGIDNWGSAAARTHVLSPVPVASEVRAVWADNYASLVLKTDDTLWIAGSALTYTAAETGETDLTTWRQAAAHVATAASCNGGLRYVDDAGVLHGAGASGEGQLGDGYVPPLETILARDVVAAATGQNFNLYVRSDGTLWRQEDGTETAIATTGTVKQVWIGPYQLRSAYLTDDGRLWSLQPDDSSTLIDSGVSTAGAGVDYVAYLKTDGTLWGRGSDSFIQFGDGSAPVQVASGVTSMSAGGWHLFFVKTDHTLWAMGTMWGGYSDDWSEWSAHVSSPRQMETDVLLAAANASQNAYVKTDGSLWARGSGWSSSAGSVAQIASGVDAVAINESTVLYTTGDGVLHDRYHEIAENVTSFSAQNGSYAFTQPAAAGLPPVLTELPVPVVADLGSSVTLRGSATGSWPISFQWYKDGVAIPGANSYSEDWGEARLTMPYLTAEAVGSYTLTATNAAGSVTSEPVTVSVPAAPTLTAQTAWQTVFAGNDATFRVTAPGAATYRWERSTDGGTEWAALADDDTFGGTGSAALTVRDVGPEMTGWLFRVVATNDLGSVTSGAAALTTAAYPATPGMAWGDGGGSYQLPVHTPKAIMGSVAQVAAGGTHTLILKTDGTLWTTGSNNNGQLGDGTTTDRSTPVQVADHVAQISASGSATMFVKTDGTLWATGAAWSGKLGTGDEVNRSTPVQVATGVTAVAAGGAHTLFVKSDHTLWAMGSNSDGQLGDGTTTNRFTPVQVATSVARVAACCFGNSSYFVKTDGTLWAMGQNLQGQLGNGTTADQIVPQQIATGVADVSAGGNNAVFLKTDGTVWGMGENDHGELGDGTLVNRSTPVRIGSGAVKIASGNGRSFFLKADGSLWGTGSTLDGGLVDPSLTAAEVTTPVRVATSVAAVSAESHTMFITTDGVLWGVGSDSNGQLGDRQVAAQVALGTNVVVAAPGMAGVNLLVGADGTLWRNNGIATTRIDGVSDVVDAWIGAYGKRLLYLKGDGTLWRLSSADQSSLLATDVIAAGAGLDYDVYLKTDGTLWGVGGSATMIEFGDMTAPVQVADHVRTVAAAGWHFLFIKDDQTLWGMGTAWQGLLPGDVYAASIASPVQLETGVVAAQATAWQNLYVTTAGELWTRAQGWGPWSGSPAMVDTDVVAFACGMNATLYTKADGVLRRRPGVNNELGTVEELAGHVIAVRGGTDGWATYLQASDSGTAPTIVTPPAPASAKLGDLVTLAVAADGSSPISYQWYKDGLAVDWARSAEYPIPYAIAGDAGSYRVDVTNAAGMVTSEAVTVAVDVPPTIGAIANQTTKEDTATAALAFTVGDTTTAASALAVTATSSNLALIPASGIALGGSGANRTVKLTPAANANGTATITLTVGDGGQTATTSFKVTVTAVNDAPTIAAIANQTTKEDTATGTIAFKVADIDTATTALTVTGASSNTALIPTAGIALGGSGANRTVKLTPVANASGSATITLTVSDGAQTVKTSFTVTVTAVNDGPTITKPADVVIAKGKNRTITFTVADRETTASQLAVTRASSNTSLLPTANLVLGGTTGNRTLKITPVSTQTGAATVTLTVADANGAKASTTFKVTVANPPTIAKIADQTTNEDTPTGAIAVKLADADTATTKLTLSATSSNTTLVPADGYTFGGSGANRTLKIKPGANATGTATVTVTASDGALTATTSFKLTVKAVNDAPTIGAIANQTTNRNTTTKAIAFKIADAETAATKLVLTKASSNTQLLPTANIVLGGSGTNRTVTLKPATNRTGSAKVTITVSDGQLSANRTFTLTVNAPPTISTVANQTIAKNQSTAVLKFTVGDAETTASKLTVTKASSNAALVATTGIVLGGTTANRTVKVTPVANKTGSAKITLSVSDGSATTSTSFTVTVTSSATKTDVAATATPAMTTQPESQVVKVGATVTLSVQADGAASYQWTHDGLPVAGASAATLPLPAVALTDAGGYAVTATNEVGSTTSATAELTVVDASATATVHGDTIVIEQTVAVAGAADSARLSVLLPAGWSYITGTDAGADETPMAGETSLLEWTWTSVPVQPVHFTYVLRSPGSARSGDRLDALIRVEVATGVGEVRFDGPTIRR